MALRCGICSQRKVSVFIIHGTLTSEKFLMLTINTHRFLIESISRQCHLKTLLMSCFDTFYKSLINSPKFTVRFLARLFERDQRTVLGSTLHYLTKQCNIKESKLDELSSQLVKKSLVFEDIPPDRQWTCQIIITIRNLNPQNLIS